MSRRPTGRRIGICVIFISLICLSGCVTIPVSVDSTVKGDGTIGSYELRLNMSQNVYGYIRRGAHSEGYPSTEKYIKDKLLSGIDRNNVGNVEYSESFEGGNVTVTIRLEDYTPAERSSISVTKRNGTLMYTDRTFMQPDAAAKQDSVVAPVRYTVTMPGDILNSTADSVDGDTATWDMTDAEASRTRIHAKSEISTRLSLLPMTGDPTVLAFPIVIGIILIYWIRHHRSNQ